MKTIPPTHASKLVALYPIHKACAYPFAISWAVATLCVWTAVSIHFSKAGAFDELFSDWFRLLALLLFYAMTSGLAFFAGAFCLSSLILRLCRRFNGAPHEIGERVLILSGPRSGTSGVARNIVKGQGGQPVVVVDIGNAAGGGFFEEYEALRLPPAAPEN
jgi:hypothetical protein